MLGKWEGVISHTCAQSHCPDSSPLEQNNSSSSISCSLSSSSHQGSSVVALISSKSSYLSVPELNVLKRGEEKTTGGREKKGRCSRVVEGGWMGAGHGFHHIWEEEEGEKINSSSRERGRESEDFQNHK